MKTVIWTDKKRYFGLPISFTKYILTPDKIESQIGLLSVAYDETLLYRIVDCKVIVNFWQRIFGVGTVILTSSEYTLGNIMKLENIKDPLKVKDMISEIVANKRSNFRYYENTGESSLSYSDANHDGFPDFIS